jgi:ketosteroid isomerase-like protein
LARIAPRLAEIDSSFAANDAARFVAVFGDKAILMPLANYAYHNHTGLQNYFKAMHASGMTSIHHPMIFDAMQSGNLVWVRASYVEAKGPTPVNFGEAIYVLEDVNGQLFVRYATYTNDAPTGHDQSDTLGDEAARTKVMARLTELEKAYEAGDIEAVSHMFTEKSKVLPQHYTVYGQEGARLHYQEKHDKGITKVVYSVVEAKQIADWIIARVTWRAYKGEEFVKEGKALFAFQDVGGQLMIHYEAIDKDWVASEHPGLESDVRELWRNWENAYKSGNWAALTALYAPEAMENPATLEMAMTPPGVTSFWQSNAPKVPWFYVEVYEVIPAGPDYAVSYSVFHEQNAAGVASAEGTMVTVYKIIGGKPKILWNSWNYN